MVAGGSIPAGSSRALRLDPFALPVRFPARDASADGQIRQVEIDRDRVTLRRAVSGMSINIGVPIRAFHGVALRLLSSEKDAPAAIAVVLDHRDAALSVPLFTAFDSDDVVAIWKSWGSVLGLPLLIAEQDGRLREVFPRLGQVRLDPPTPRRRRRSVLRRRRPSILLRRRPGNPRGNPVIHREREIIARN